jgi:DNA invertase Pin-like site-specific DNA recombinase
MLPDTMARRMARQPKARVPKIAYLRTSSATNVGVDKDSDKRQRQPIEAFWRHSGDELVDEFYDTAVSGADPIETRPGFALMLERIEASGVRTIIVETANRFARDLMVQEVFHARLRERGISLVAADSPNAFLDNTPTAKVGAPSARRHRRVRQGHARRQAARRARAQAQGPRQVRGSQVARRDASRRCA